MPVKIGVDFDTDKAQKSIEELTNEWKKSLKSVEEQKSKVKELSDYIDKMILKVKDDLNSFFRNSEAADKAFKHIFNTDIKPLNDQLEKLNENLSNAEKTSNKLGESLQRAIIQKGLPIYTKQLNTQLKQITPNITSIQPALSNIKTNTTNFSTITKQLTSNLGKLSPQLKPITSDLGQMQTITGKINTQSGKLNTQVKQLTSNIGKMPISRINEFNKSISKDVYSNFSKNFLKFLVSDIIPNISNLFKSSFSNIQKSFKNILLTPINIFKSSLSGIGNIFNNLISGINTFISRIGKLAAYTFIFTVINSGFRTIRNATIDYINTNNQLQSNLAQIRGNLLTAFQPIWEFILPNLIKFTQLISQATAYISAFISALFGKTEQSSRNNAKALQTQIALSKESSKSLKKQKKNTDDLIKSNKKNYMSLAKFDELTLISKNKKTLKTPKASTPEALTPTEGIPSGISFETPKIDTSGIQSLVDKIKEYFLPLQEPFDKLMNSLDRLKGYTFEAFKDFYNFFLKPISDFVVNTALPDLMNNIADMLDKMNLDKVNEALRELWQALEPLTEDAIKGVLWIFDNLLAPLATWTVNVLLINFLESLKNILEIIRPIAEKAGEQLIKLWDEFLKPMAEWTGGVISEKLTEFNDVLKNISNWLKDPKNKTRLEWLSAFLTGLGTTVIGAVLVPALWKLVTATTAWTVALLANPMTWVVVGIGLLIAAIIMLVTHFDDVKQAATEAWDSFKNGAKEAIESFKKLPFGKYVTEMIDNVKGIFNGLIDFITGVFTGDWGKAFKGLKNVVIGIFNSLITAINTGINIIKSIINGVLEKANIVIKGINLIPGVSIPNIPTFDTTKETIGKIPYLATGAVIPPNSPFLAMLGDQKSGTNIEAPLETIKQAFKEALQENSINGNGNYTFVAQLDGRTIFEETVRQNDMYAQQSGRSAFAY